MSHKRIVIITNEYAPVPAVRGGAVENLTEELLRRNELNPEFHFMVYTPTDPEAAKVASQYEHSEFHFISRSCNGIGEQVEYGLRRFTNRFNRNHFHDPYIDHVVAELRKIYTPGMILIVEHASLFTLPLREAFPEAKIILHLHNDWVNVDSVYCRPIVRAVNQFWAVSKYIKKRTLTCGDSDVRLLYNGVEERFYTPADVNSLNDLRKKLGISPQTRVILFAGRLNREKGIRKLVEAYGKLEKENILLLILGGINYMDNTMTGYAKALYEECAKSPNPIQFTGYIPYESIPLYYRLAKVCVMPSEFEEPFGMVAAEALACGVPVIATKAGGLPEIITPDCGILIENDAHVTENLIPAMEKLLNEQEVWARMKVAAEIQARKFTSSARFAEFCKLLNDACRQEAVR